MYLFNWDITNIYFCFMYEHITLQYSTVQPNVFLLTVSCIDSPIVGWKDFLQKAVGETDRHCLAHKDVCIYFYSNWFYSIIFDFLPYLLLTWFDLIQFIKPPRLLCNTMLFSTLLYLWYLDLQLWNLWSLVLSGLPTELDFLSE